jgi:hypothetical protein
LINLVISEEELDKLQNSTGNIKKTTLLGKLIKQLKENKELTASDVVISQWITNKTNTSSDLLEEDEEFILIVKKNKIQLIKELRASDPKLSPHKAKTKARTILKHQEKEKTILEKEKKKQIGSKTPTKIFNTPKKGSSMPKKMSKTSSVHGMSSYFDCCNIFKIYQNKAYKNTMLFRYILNISQQSK